jgi:hypothetical protein
MVHSTPSADFDVAGGGSDVMYFSGHPRYDAVRVDFDDGSSSSLNTDVTVKIDDNDDVSDIMAGGFGSMDATVYSASGVDPSSGASAGTDALGRVVAVEIDEQSGTDNAAGSVVLHSASDPAQNAQAFANR